MMFRVPESRLLEPSEKSECVDCAEILPDELMRFTAYGEALCEECFENRL